MLHFVFYVLRLLFISLGSMFQDLPSLTHTKKLSSFPFSIFTFTPLYTHVQSLYFLWFNVSRLIFVTFCIQCFKTSIYFIWFNVSRPSISHTHKKLFAFPFILFTFTPLYTHVHSLSYHPISNTLKEKMISFSFDLSMIPT